MWGSRFFTARYWTARFFSATGATPVIIPVNVVKTLGLFLSPQTIGNLSTTSMNGIVKAPTTIGTLK